jgi:hypothetical protein
VCNFSITATGTTGTAHLPNFIHVHEDDRLITRTGAPVVALVR